MKYLILIIMTASIALAQPGGFHKGTGMMGRGFDRMESILGLNADQEKKVDELRSEMQKKQIDLRSQIQKMHIELRDMYNQDNPDQKAIESKLTQINKIRNDMQLNRTQFWFSVNKILTDDQKKLWKEYKNTAGPQREFYGRSRDFRGRGFDGDDNRPNRPFRMHRNSDCPYR